MEKFLKEQVERIKPDKEETAEIKEQTAELIETLKNNLKKKKISAEVFVGGSSAKGTLIKKSKYDIDLFVRFNKDYEEKTLSSLLKKAVPSGALEKKGSRNYFSLLKNGIEFEIVPVLRINKPEEAKNITDLSYFHVNYVNKSIKKCKKLADEIILAKAFAYFQGCYGAESYINGFSGYAIELLVINYKSFLAFARAISRADIKKQKLVLDPARHFKSKQEIFKELNESKILSPVIVIDPTYKERNALAALSSDTFLKFQAACRSFLKNPCAEFFKLRDNPDEMRKKYKEKLIKIQIATNKQAGDIAGTKLKKFSAFFLKELERHFDIKDSFFEYDENQNIGEIYLAAEPKKEIIFQGPPVKMERAAAAFKRAHKTAKIRAGRLYAVKKLKNFSFNKFMRGFKTKKKKIIKEMSISALSIIAKDAFN